MSHYQSLMSEYNAASTWEVPEIITGSNFLGPNLLAISALIMFLIVVGPKQTISEKVGYVVLSLACALTMGFGTILTSNWVGVYV